MSYVWVYKFTDSDGYEEEVPININTLDDLLNPNNWLYLRHNHFGSWRKWFADLLGKIKTAKVNKHPRKRLADEMAKQIAITFFEELTQDLLYNKVTYQFPYRFFAHLGVREVDWIEGELTETHKTVPLLMFTKGGQKRVRKIIYNVKFTERWRNRLNELVENGQRFPKFIRNASS